MAKGFFYFVLSTYIFSAFAIENIYNGYKVYDISAKSQEDLEFLKNLKLSEGERRSLDFLSFHNNVKDIIRLLVKPEEQIYIEKLLKQKGIDFKVAVENIQE